MRKYWISGSDRKYPCDDWLQLTLHMSHQTNHRVIAQITVHSNKSDQSNISRLSGSGGEEKEDKTNVARYVYIEAILNICIPSDMEWEHSEIPR